MYKRQGQHIYTEPRGRFAGYEWPQFSIHRGTLHENLVNTVRERLGPNAFLTGHRFYRLEQDAEKVVAYFHTGTSEQILKSYRGSALVGCDGIKSVVRRLFYEKDDPLIYSGITMWRGVTKHQPFLTGASMIYAGWLKTGKVIAYPIAKLDNGMQIVNCLLYTSPSPRD